MLHHLFQSIDTVFCTNAATDGLRKEPISTKKLGQGDTAWSNKKKLMGWELNTKEHHLRLTPKRDLKVRAALDTIPSEACQVSLRKWWHLLCILRSITPSVYGAQGMFKLLQNKLQQARGRQVQMSPAFQDELSAWRQLVQELAARPTHLRELDPFLLTW